MVGPVGAGKSALIAALARRLHARDIRVGVLVACQGGDAGIGPFRDLGMPVAPVEVVRGCYLTASLLQQALEGFPLSAVDVVFVEDLGGLACQANRPLGTDRDLVVVSVVGGSGVMERYPVPFIQTGLLAVNKADLAEVTGQDPQEIVARYRKLNPYGRAVITAAETGLGVEELLSALEL